MESIFIVEDGNKRNLSVKILESTAQDIKFIEETINFDANSFINNAIEFNGSYKPEEDESLKISGFELPIEIKEAITNPLEVEKFLPDTNSNLNVKSIFIPIYIDEDNEKIIFQRIKKHQILLGKNITLMWDNSTFITTKKPAVVITDAIDIYYENEVLYFKSYYWANQILNLNKYYREATNDDIKTFCLSSCISIEEDNVDELIPTCNNWTRRKIAYILDSKVLENKSSRFIIESARDLGLNFNLDNYGKIIFPKNSSQQKEILSYLADEIYKGNLTEDLYLTNSKRILKN